MTARITASTYEVLIDRATMFELGQDRKVRNFARSLLPEGILPIDSGHTEAVDHNTYKIVFRVAEYIDEPEAHQVVNTHEPSSLDGLKVLGEPVNEAQIRSMMLNFWGPAQWPALLALVQSESGWRFRGAAS